MIFKTIPHRILGPTEWIDLKDEELLEIRISNLHLRLEGTSLQERIQELHQELENKKIPFKPICYLADEWFVPTESTNIAIPFYLAHPRLMELEKKMILEVEGGTKEECQRLLRHETGHALYYAYALHQDKKLKQIFGPPSEETPVTYRPKPYSKNFVRHLPNWYAQCDPDEDFAETFAVWLTPGFDWKEHYKGWKALRKLEYIEALINSLAGKPPSIIKSDRSCATSSLRYTLKTYYARKKKTYEEDYPDFYDPDLRKIFSDKSDFFNHELARSFMARHRKMIIDKIALWTGDKKYNCARLLKKLMERCNQLSLRLCRGEMESIMDVTAYLTRMMTHHLLTGRFKRTV